jgi:hypothetical protein
MHLFGNIFHAQPVHQDRSGTLKKFPDLPNKQTELKKHGVRLDETNLKEKFDEIDI